MGTDELPEKKVEAYERYKALADTIKAGNPGFGKFDKFTIYDEWKKLLIDAEKYGSSICIYDIIVGNLEEESLDYKTKTATYSAKIDYTLGDRYYKTIGVVEQGLKTARRNDWEGIPYGWPKNSISSNSTEGVLIYTDYSDYNAFMLQLYSFDFNLVDQNGKEIVEKKRWILGESQRIYFSEINSETMKLIDSGKVFVNPVACYLKYGDRSRYDPVKDIYIRDVYKEMSLPINQAMLICWNNKSDKVKENVLQTEKYGNKYRIINNLGMINVEGLSIQMMKTEVTQALYEAVMGENPSTFKGTNLPVESVNWVDAIIFCNKLSELKGLTPVYSLNGKTKVADWNKSQDYIYKNVKQNMNANGFRLPISDEWYYASEGGEEFERPGSNNANEIGWYERNSGGRTHPVAQKKPNGYGLYDMWGNVAEWIWERGKGYRMATPDVWYSLAQGASWDRSEGCDYIAEVYGCYDQEVGFRIVRSNVQILKEAQQDLLKDFTNRTSKTYIDDEFLDLGEIEYIEAFEGKLYFTRLYAIANQASTKKGFTPYYCQKIGDKYVYDTSKWKLGEQIYHDDNATGFIIRGDSKNSLTLVRKDSAHKAQVDEVRKAQRNKEDEEYVKKILAMGPSEWDSSSGKIKYASNNGFDFDASGYKNQSGTLRDKTREYGILNKASEKLGYKPCYYQELDGKRVFDAEKWQLGTWNGTWEKGNGIKLDESKNGFYCENDYIIRKDLETISLLENEKSSVVKTYVDKISLNGSVKEYNDTLTFNIPLDESYNQSASSFVLKDSSGKSWTISKDDFLARIRESTGQNYTISSSELIRTPTENEKAEYEKEKDKVIQETVKSYFERINVDGKVSKHSVYDYRTGENTDSIVYRINLDNSFNEYTSTFLLDGSAGRRFKLSQSDFLSRLKVITGQEYKLHNSIQMSEQYLYRDATKKEKESYAFENGKLHTNIVCKVKDSWMRILETTEVEGGFAVKSFRIKKSVFEKNGIKTKDVIKRIVLVYESGRALEIGVSYLWTSIPAPSKLIFTVERGKGKKAQTLTIEIPVEWNEDELKLL